MNFNEALNFIESLINYEKKFLEYSETHYNPLKLKEALLKTKVSFENIKFFHIAGTKGKGSTSIYLANLLHLYYNSNVGLYTSPHVFKINERIVVNNRQISDEDFANLVTEYKEIILNENFTYFEALTFIAIIYFKRQNCEYVVLETGLGGRLDATNFCTPLVSIITSIGFDHTKVLGNTLEKIAFEKAGIIKEKVSVVCTGQRKNALRVIKKVCKGKNSPFFYLPEIVKYKVKKREKTGVTINLKFKNFKVNVNNLKLSIPSEIFIQNFLLAVLAFSVSEAKAKKIELVNIIRETGKVKLPFRMQVEDNFIFDVAHNDDSLDALFKNFLRFKLDGEKEVILIVGILIDKEIERIAKVILKYHRVFKEIILFELKGPRASGSKILFELLNKKKLRNIRYVSEKKEILFKSDYTYIITGSFYIIKEFYSKNF